MGQARTERRRIEREERERIKAMMTEAYRDRQWNRQALKDLLPPGEEPIATRYDPANNLLNVACASGTTYSFPMAQLERAERRTMPMMIEPFATPDNDPRRQLREMEQAWRDYQEAKRVENERQRQTQEEQSPAPSPPPNFDEQWAIAEARCAEAIIAGAVGDTCYGRILSCGNEPVVLLKTPWRKAQPFCKTCAMDVLREDVSALDCNPNE